MENKINFELYSFYNLARYLFLKLEYTHNLDIEEHGLTLPQLRVLWILKCFPGISQENISKIGCWSPPTVSSIIKLLMQKGYIYNEETINKKTYNLKLTTLGENKLSDVKITRTSSAAILKLLNQISYDDINLLVKTLKKLIISGENNYVPEYIDKLNQYELKFDFNEFNFSDSNYIKTLTTVYNLLRIFVLTVERKHSNMLANVGLTYPQLRALNIIKAFPGINSAELSTLGFWSRSTANLIVNNLHKKGFLLKERGNIKNSINLFVTSTGESILSYDIKNNLRNIDMLNTLKANTYENLVYINSILYKMNLLVGNDIIDIFINKTYESINNNP
ncbi:MarR family transcriptional regulator [Fervidicella metallireducens AeB]|uniref:MarR family transcriptional regulator n=1 Tax=Fervidicella metallireducens AeB TaxID=1403537 RepID=A0A017RV83_9CLOT|nr:MarR family transcriptional regulator [Fervidicella metallireducens]EYE88678.1 MarR family transcriptional regulator [Fervidicella metallireducens AeB]